jgi:predicted nucleic acid-binding protein
MALAVDASMSASWVLPDESTARTVKALQILRKASAFAPQLWWFEVRNIFVVNERRGRLTQKTTAAGLDLLKRLPIEIDTAPREEEIFRLARRHALTFCDAAYLELAVRKQLMLASLDKDLVEAARQEKVEVLEL